MKIAITGHTSGIGLALANILQQDHTIVGLSRSNGYDIEDVFGIVHAANDCDVFINNAYCEYQQALLLQELYFKWEDTDNQIINIGSVVTNYPRSQIELDSSPWPYRDHKIALEKMFRKLVWRHSPCSLHLISPGPVDTPMVKHLNVPKLNTESVVDAVDMVMKNKHIKELTLWR
jgi:NAD(P)-dependent dehydrogenase (short-subunit alcohol dehydrogenase family)